MNAWYTANFHKLVLFGISFIIAKDIKIISFFSVKSLWQFIRNDSMFSLQKLVIKNDWILSKFSQVLGLILFMILFNCLLISRAVLNCLFFHSPRSCSLGAYKVINNSNWRQVFYLVILLKVVIDMESTESTEKLRLKNYEGEWGKCTA